MPFYEYQCKNCGHDLEAMQKINDPPLKKCPHCGKSQLERLMSAPVFRLKGGGWYETDFKGDQDSKRNLADRPDADAPKEAKDAKEGDKAADKSSEAKSTESKDGKDGKESKESKDGKPAEKSPDKPVKESKPARAGQKRSGGPAKAGSHRPARKAPPKRRKGRR
ncbi:MAG TPA: FmdB family zinc ribbon protein [Steroidobacteraceae bacterium]|jgi:putative FmdB family regulatory protein|nr:FmdB family zinc ribbon protein [Steroidobacteraceae bacterium]